MLTNTGSGLGLVPKFCSAMLGVLLLMLVVNVFPFCRGKKKKRTKKNNFVLFYLHLHFFSGRPKQNVTSAYLHLSAAL